MNAVTDTELLAAARRALENAYAPYSGFFVGAALLASSGRVYTGCNVENRSYGATVCAERVALFKAVAEGEREFLKAAVVSRGGRKTPPCGVCRQALSEFCGPETEIIVEDGEGGALALTLGMLLPEAELPL